MRIFLGLLRDISTSLFIAMLLGAMSEKRKDKWQYLLAIVLLILISI